MRLATIFVALLSAAGLATATAGARESAVDVSTNVAVGPTLRDVRPQLNGATVQTKLAFWAGPGLDLITALPATATVRFVLPAGIAFGGSDLPDPSESCSATATSATCTAPLEPLTGRNSVGWGWDLVAATAGTYVLTAEIVQSSDVDPDASNDRATVTVVASSSEPSGGGGGGTTRISAGAAKLSPAKPRAGATVVASVRMTAGADPVRPTSVSCAATAGTAKVKGVGRAGNGSATCTFKTPKTAKHKTLRGAVSFSVLGDRYTRRFSTRLG